MKTALKFSGLFDILPVLAIYFFTSTGCVNSGYYIEIEVEGLKNSMAYLGYYDGTNPYLKDSVMVDSKGGIRFRGDKMLKEGVYFFYSKPHNFSFDFVVTDSRTLLKTSKEKPLEDLEDLESGDNAVFFQFRKEINDFRKAMGLSWQLLGAAQNKQDSLSHIIGMKRKELELLESQKLMIKEHENTTIGCILQYMRLPEQPPLYPEQWEKPEYQKKRRIFYRRHFWNHINFNDSLLLRVPILKYRLDEFFDHVVEQRPDSIIKAMDEVMLKTSVNNLVYRQTLMELALKYITPPLLDQDKAFVHFSDNYIMNDEAASWINTNMHDHISRIVEKMRPNIIGKKAPRLQMNTLDGKEIDLYDINASYTILFFYDPECDHCSVESKKIKKNHKVLKEKGVEIMAICISPDSEKCRQYVSNQHDITWINVSDPENSSRYKEKYNIFAAPMLFLLNQEKKIVAKNTGFDEIVYQLH